MFLPTRPVLGSPVRTFVYAEMLTVGFERLSHGLPVNRSIAIIKGWIEGCD